VNAAANFWKHRDEWESEGDDGQRDRTLRVLSAVGVTGETDRPLTVILNGLRGMTIMDIARALLPWRDELLAKARSAEQ
ncbi:MAG TPA: hypothetical protein VF505_19640, partial [Thermoanaerobaculia bacterium]